VTPERIRAATPERIRAVTAVRRGGYVASACLATRTAVSALAVRELLGMNGRLHLKVRDWSGKLLVDCWSKQVDKAGAFTVARAGR